jgi:BarA-like signal transduction histidine kinase
MPDGFTRMKLSIHWLEGMQGKLATASGLAVYVLKAVPSNAKVLAETVGGS